MLLIHNSFYFFDSDRDAFLASETGAFRSNQNIIFQADASKTEIRIILDARILAYPTVFVQRENKYNKNIF